ncbi:MAG: site-2 protease family protein [Candidatus Amesbacteria bacterium]|nr:site-2 protease family protein [Candidatus Amesbacteria bacterium]
MLTFFVFLGVLSVLVLIHELGHFMAARYFGIRVDEFAFGLPFTKPIFKFQHGETQYAIYPLIFGGFVKLHGEENEVKDDKKRSFWNRGRRQRMIVLVAGVTMNIVLALSLFVTLYLVLGVPGKVQNLITVNFVEPNSPAAASGLIASDRVISVNGQTLTSTPEFSQAMIKYAGTPTDIVVRRGATVPLFEGIVEKSTQEIVLTAIPRVNPPAGQGALGVSISQYPYVQTSKTGNVFLASIRVTGKWIERVFDGFRSIGKSLMAGKKPEGVAGPIGIYQLTGVVAGEGILPIMELIAILSVNLAIFNVLPIPALDGGRMFFVWLEWVRRKRISAELEAKINNWGMIFLLTLIALISLQDVIRIWWK